MTALAHLPRAIPFNAVRFYAYRIPESGRTYQLDFAEGATLDEVLESAKVHCFHKDHLLIQEIGEDKERAHLYSIKRKSQPTYVYRDYQTHREHRLYAAPVCSFDASILQSPRDGSEDRNSLPTNQ